MGLKSSMLLEKRAAEYRERAEYYKKRAIIESIKEGFHIDLEKGVDLIDVTETTAITFPGSNQIEFARDDRGVYFARIECGKYYPINIEPPEHLLRKGEEQEELARSFWKRLKREPYELTSAPLIYYLEDLTFTLSDSVFKFELALLKGLEPLTDLEETLDRKVNQLEKKNEDQGSLNPFLNF